MKQLILTCIGLSLLTAIAINAAATVPQGEPIPFTTEFWELNRAQVFEHQGTEVLTGFAKLKNVKFQNGVIEVDVLAPHAKTYPGVIFRMQSADDYERFYIRPHRSGHYPDALQYTPVFGGIAGWQLYHGDGYTAPIDELPRSEWIHVRIEVSGDQARVYIGDSTNSEQPALKIDRLGHGLSSGHLGLYGPMDQQVCFANFSFTADDDLLFSPPSPIEASADIITTWELSRAYPENRVNRTRYPRFYSIF